LPHKAIAGYQTYCLEDSDHRKFLLSIPSEFKPGEGVLSGEYLFSNDAKDELIISVESRLEDGALTMFQKDANDADPARKTVQIDGAILHWNVLATSRKQEKLSIGFWFRSPSAVAIKFRTKSNMSSQLKLILDSIRYDSRLQETAEIEKFVGQPVKSLPYVKRNF